eukprot:scaffold659917_cov57-Prasinocladus_malaysianus.AAC.1
MSGRRATPACGLMPSTFAWARYMSLPEHISRGSVELPTGLASPALLSVIHTEKRPPDLLACAKQMASGRLPRPTYLMYGIGTMHNQPVSLNIWLSIRL